jgi:hypothetical protein
MPLAESLVWTVTSWTCVLIVRKLRRSGRSLRSVAIHALTFALAITSLGGLARKERHAGTGTYTTWGWPRPYYTQWISLELSPSSPDYRHGGPNVAGFAESVVFYSGFAAVAGELIRSRRKGQRPGE